MRALLINPWIHDFSAYDLWSKPLGLLQIASFLKYQKAEVRLIDCLDRFHPRLINFLANKLPRSSLYGCGHYYWEEIGKPEIYRHIPRTYKRYGLPKNIFLDLLREEPLPDIILITSGMTYWYPGVFEVIKILREYFPATKIILGGIYAKLCFAHARENSEADRVYPGNDLTEIGKIIAELTGNKSPYQTFNQEEYFPPAYELYKELKYVTLRTSSGCPFRCTYCAWYILEPKFKQYSPGTLITQIEYLNRIRGIKNFSFYDEALLFKAPAHLLPILKGLLKRKVSANFHTPNGLHIKYITRKLAELLKESGFIRPRLGLETTIRQRQIESGDKTTNTEFLTAVKLLQKAGYSSAEIGVNILIGLPGQKAEELRETIDFVKDQGCRIFLEQYSPIPGTPEYAKSGLPSDTDPLLHNKSIFPLYNQQEAEKLQEIKNYVREINS